MRSLLASRAVSPCFYIRVHTLHCNSSFPIILASSPLDFDGSSPSITTFSLARRSMAQLSLAALAAHLETIELTESLFPGDGELSLSESTAAALPTLRSWIESGSPQPADAPAPTEELALTIQLALDQHDAATTFVLPLQVRLPLVEPKDPALVLPDDAQTPAAVVHATQPPWMSRAAHDQLAATLPKPGDGGAASNVDLLLAAIDHIRSITPYLLPAPSPPPSTVDRARGGRKRPSPGDNSGDEPEYRVWFWFPSLSTREKRDDMVNWAPEYGLTGFVLAGAFSNVCSGA